MDLLQKIRTIPTEPGVYLYKNAEGEVIYVGKAKNLRSRVASYSSPTIKKRWRSRTISSSSVNRASTSCCATTRLTLT